jgi:hypothetical protein
MSAAKIADLVLFILCFIGICFFVIYSIRRNRTLLARLQSVIDGQISKKFMRGGYQRCLIGTWQGLPVEAVLEKIGGSVNFFVTLYVRYPLPCPTIFILPFTSPVVSDVITGDLNTFNFGQTFEIPEFNIKIISKAADNQQLLDFITPQRLQILNTIFSKGFNCIEIHQEESPESYIRVGYQYQGRDLHSIPVSMYESVVKPDTINHILMQLKDF